MKQGQNENRAQRQQKQQKLGKIIQTSTDENITITINITQIHFERARERENAWNTREWKTKQQMVEKRRKYTFTVKTEKKTECGTQNTEANAKRGEPKW